MTTAPSSRNVVVVICGLILAITLVSLGKWINLHTTAVRELTLEHGGNLPGYFVENQEEIRRKYGLYFGQLVNKRQQQEEFLIYPSIAIVIGAFVGLFATRRVILLTGVCLLPLFWEVSANWWLWGRRLPLVPVYLILGLLVAVLASRLKRRMLY